MRRGREDTTSCRQPASRWKLEVLRSSQYGKACQTSGSSDSPRSRHTEVSMEFELKTLSSEAVQRALAKAERYRLLNEPGEAESICRDALQVDPDNQEAVVMLLLALTEQFDHDVAEAVKDAWKCAERIRDEYDRAYYTGII